MSEFSNLLSKLVEEKDVKVYPMVQYCNLDRSTMYKIINGKRNPSSLQLVHKICEYMNLTPAESEKLVEAYHITLIGSEVYYRRKHVKNFIKKFHTLCTPLCTTIKFPVWTSEIFSGDKESFPLSGRSQINNALLGMLMQSPQKIQMVIQPDYSFLMDLLVSISQSSSQLEIEHILCLNNHESITSDRLHYNLMCLEKILPMYYGDCKYTPYYYYDDITSHFHSLSLFPYLILTDTGAITCSCDLQYGILYKNPQTILMFREIFYNYRQSTSQLINQVNSFTEQCQSLSQMKIGTDTAYSFQSEPCLIPFIPQNWLEKYIYPDFPDRDMAISLLKDYIPTRSRKSSQHLLVSYFNKKGILNFMNTGRLGEIPEELCAPFSMEDRIYLLNKLIDSFQTNDCFMLKNELAEIPPKLYIYANNQCGYLLFPDKNGCITHLTLEEHSLLNTFYDFVGSLKENEFLYSKEETIEFLKTLLEEARKRTGVYPPPGKNLIIFYDETDLEKDS